MPNKPTNRAAEVVCPFFRYEDTREQRIACEGIPFHATLITRWQTNKTRVDFMNIYCCKDYRTCPIARAIEDFKYSDF